MIVNIQPSTLHGVLHAPASKSSMQRALAAALLMKGRSVIENPGFSNDDLAAIEIIKALGAKLHKEESTLKITSDGVDPVMDSVNCHESGLSIRMFTPIAALSNKKIRITGSGSLESRPMDVFDQIFPQLGVQIDTNKGKLPMAVQGPLKPADIEIDGSLSSQFLTGMIMAYSASGANNVSITVKQLKSKPYIDLTLDVMKKFGLTIPRNEGYKKFYFECDEIQSQKTKQVSASYTVEGDWSGAAFLLIAGAIAGPITVRGLDLTSFQADKVIVDALMEAQAGIAIDAKGITVHPSSLRAFDFDATHCPDLFPPLAVLAAFCKGRSQLKGVHRLAHKESNRAITLKDELGKLGVNIELGEDLMIINGANKIVGADVSSRHDHRIAMACAIAALKAHGKTTISNADAVNKSYPGFYKDLKSLGAVVSLL